MPPTRKEINCTEHSVDIAVLKQEVENIKEHTAEIIDTIKSEFKDLNDKIRKLEDRKVVSMFLEKFMWIAIGVFISVLIQNNLNNYLAIREKAEYKIVKQKNKQ
ncbi:MAG TPA: hypothetical protein DCS19_13045 [Flavobacterium sp.]|nr:hypothetical protein [Flavobacterium sp.]